MANGIADNVILSGDADEGCECGPVCGFRLDYGVMALFNTAIDDIDTFHIKEVH